MKTAGCWRKTRTSVFDPAKAKKKGDASQEKGGQPEVSNAAVGSGTEKLLMAMHFPRMIGLLDDPNIWIVDTAATCDSTPSFVGGVNPKTVQDGVIFSDGKSNKAGVVFDLLGMITNSEGNELQKDTLTNVKLVKSARFNLFSLTKRQKDGWKLHGDSKRIWLRKGNNKIIFDICIPTPEGLILAMHFHLQTSTEVSAASPEQPKKISIQALHDQLGHMNETMCRKVAKALDWEVKKGSLAVCLSCLIAKAKQKNINIDRKGNETKPDGLNRLFLDIGSIKQPKTILTEVTWWNCRIMVDEKTQLKFVDFFEAKNDMIEPTCVQLKKWEQAKKKVDVIRLENGGENVKLEKRASSKDWQLGIKFEYTVQDTPQQNNLAEIRLTVVAN
jgi:hypothetical protein